jgi:Trk K+ transport system NAD-binding subunit
MDQPVIVCGLGRVGWRILEYVQKSGMPAVAIDTVCAPDDPRLAGVRLIQGDCRRADVLQQAGLERARGVIIVTSDDLLNISTALNVRHLHPTVRVVVRMFNQNLVTRLGSAVPNVTALSVSALTAPLVALTALTGEALGTFRLNDNLWQVAEMNVAEGSSLIGRSLTDFSMGGRLLALAHQKPGEPSRFLADVDAEAQVTAGDRLVVCGPPTELQPLLAPTDDAKMAGLRWAAWWRRGSRIFRRTFREIDAPVKVVCFVLLVVIVASTLIFHLGMGRTAPDGLLRTITIIATSGDVHGEEFPEGWQKVFVAFLRLSGSALTAAFIAILTNYLIRARLGKALEIRRVPESGHLVVCGLGHVGIRVVQELLAAGRRVVVIEPTPDNQFLLTVRRKGVAVITGDPTLPEVLGQANAATARAVLATGSDDLANLEIALMARELNPKQRVVVRLSDPQLSQTLREAANIRLALSTSALAAPAFVAALFGDRVHSLFMLDGKPVAVVELLVQADDPCLNDQPIRALAVDYRLLPLSLASDGDPSWSQQMGMRLRPGDRLTAVMELGDLARLRRRVRPSAEWAVDVTGFPLPTRGWVVQLLRTERQLSAELAEKEIERLPVCLGTELSRGQAADLILRCRRERVSVRLRKINESAGESVKAFPVSLG